MNPKPYDDWPDVLELSKRERIALHHKLVLTREEFNTSMGVVAQMLLDSGTLGVKDTSDVRKYIFEMEIVD